jgi:hypothetical protein
MPVPRKPTPSAKRAALLFQSPDAIAQRNTERAEYDAMMAPEMQARLTREAQEAEAMADRVAEKRAFAAREAEQERAAFASDPDMQIARREAKHDREMAAAGTPEPAYQHAPAAGEHPVNDAAAFILAGNARFTVVSNQTGKRFTFHVRQPKAGDPHFVRVLTGPDNESSYTFVGTYFSDGTYRHGARSTISADAPSAKAAAWLMNMLRNPARLAAQATIYHSGRCGRCGRTLTVPSSILSGIGPECAGKL